MLKDLFEFLIGYLVGTLIMVDAFLCVYLFTVTKRFRFGKHWYIILLLLMLFWSLLDLYAYLKR